MPDPAALMRRTAYQEYIASPRWRKNPARLAEIAAAGHRCRLCNAGADEAELQVHHRTYERLFHELPGDLTTLCRPCHDDVTAIQRARRYQARTVVPGDFVRPLAAPGPLFDPTRR
jgi:5-methylcytosine-specific restriction endonuclease McrA